MHFAASTEEAGARAFCRAFGGGSRDFGVDVDALLVTSSEAPANATSATKDPRPRMLVDAQRLLASRYDATPGTTYLLRPDQHVCARWREFDAAALQAAIARATGRH